MKTITPIKRSRNDACISTIIRFHSIDNLSLLCESLLTLAAQIDIGVQPIIVCQRLSQNEFLYLQKTVQQYDFLFTLPIIIKNITRGEGDIRADLLNEGFRVAKTRYLAILDSDDVVYPNAYKTLIEALEKHSAAISFGGVVWADTDDIGGARYIKKKNLDFQKGSVFDLFVDNFCPIHSFAINKDLISSTDLEFNTQLIMLEDYDFLLRICAKYKSDFSSISTAVGEYRRRDNDSIRKSNNAACLPGMIRDIDAARKHIKTLKQETFTTIAISEFGNLRAYWNNAPKIPHYDDDEISALKLAQQSLILQKQAVAHFSERLLDKPNQDWPFGFVESCTRFDKSWHLSGWIIDTPGSEFSGAIFAIFNDGTIQIVDVSCERPDVAAEFDVVKSGFSVIIYTNCLSYPDVLIFHKNTIFRMKSIEAS